MATTTAVFSLFTSLFPDLSVDELKQLTRPLREAELWPSGKAGRGGARAAKVSNKHLAALALAVFIQIPPPKVLGAIQLFGNLRPLIAWEPKRHFATTPSTKTPSTKWNGKFSMLEGPIRDFMNKRIGQPSFKTEPGYKFQFMPGVTILGVFAELLKAGRNPALDLSRLNFVIDHTKSVIFFRILENGGIRSIWEQAYVPLPPKKGLIEFKEFVEEVGDGPIVNTIFDYAGREFDEGRRPTVKNVPLIRVTNVGGEIFRMIGLVNG